VYWVLNSGAEAWVIPSALICFCSYFSCRVLWFCPRLASDHDPLTASHTAGNTGTCHRTQLFAWLPTPVLPISTSRVVGIYRHESLHLPLLSVLFFWKSDIFQTYMC
jgi:hypothetical protein